MKTDLEKLRQVVFYKLAKNRSSCSLCKEFDTTPCSCERLAELEKTEFNVYRKRSSFSIRGVTNV